MASTPYPAGMESFPLLSITTPESMRLPAYFATKDIIFITSYPKSGTTWMQNIVTSLLLGSEGYDKAVDHISNYTPFLESPKTHSTIEAFFHKFDGFSCFNTHLLCDIHLPNSMWEQQPKRCFVIYCVRNMKDTIVSFYHHLSNQKGNESAAGMTFKSFLLEFVSGRLPYGCYLKHVQYYRELAVSGGGRGLAGNVLLVRYEDMIADLSGSIGAVASHLHLTLDGVEVAALAERNTFKVNPNPNLTLT